MSKLVIVGLLWLLASSAAQTCPYASLKKPSIIAADANCPSSSVCRLDPATCAVISVSKEQWFSNVDAIGDMTNFNGTELNIGGSTSMDLTKMVLRQTVTIVIIQHVKAVDISKVSNPTPATWYFNNVSTVTWPSTWPPSAMTTLVCHLCNLKTIPAALPQSVHHMSFQNNSIEDLSSVPDKVTYLDVSLNPVTTLANRNFSSALFYLDLGSTPIQSISRVAIGDSINLFGCYGCKDLKNVTITQATFNVLDKMEAYSPKLSTSTPRFSISTSVQTDAATCAAIGGTIQQLWKSKTTLVWQVCVVPEIVVSTPTDSSSSNTGLIAGIAVGVVVLVVVVGVLCYRRRQKEAKRLRYNGTSEDATNYFPVLATPAVSTGTAPGLSSTRDLSSKRGSIDDSDDVFNMAHLRKYKLEHSDLRVVGSKPMASGAYGDVWRGRYCDDDVAIKRIKHESTKHIQRFIEEIVLHSKMRCDYIVEFVGASWRRPTDLACVVEYMDLGDLRSFLSRTTPEQFTWAQKKLSITSIIHGLIYLHTFETPIIHRDLKSRNVLLDSKKGTKLTDFGESREMDDNTLTNGIGTYQWMAPEVILGKEYTVAADVYSFGVLLTEFSTHLTPYSDMINPHTHLPYNQQYLLTQVTSGTIKPTIDASHTPSWVADIARQCLATNPDDRPGMMMVDTIIRRLAS
ncbi:TKL protein kinase [Saprolegnia diclina VS20]|uniref:TKL protein kinase n=1 Tax=Saprolegnia diclina (strain VS20) TaxID=1156394 RepID=T0QJS1_SAPDV|nr:TKL protein kinase [Saprolegnia diclina VS20]EQC33980.1 TKL protein kinase [Saprolegnia diclina VS20]|eukprot:XP_008612775.1 TKL protein kinase [Saprolegnia diclina VS20]